MDRREFLRALAAGVTLPAALSRCTDADDYYLSWELDGQLLGPSFEIGHQLRDGALDLPQAGPVQVDEPVRAVVVVGGGLSGLASAWALQRSGLEDFVVLEREEVPGGLARSGTLGDLTFPWGAHYIGLPDPESTVLMHFLSDVGVIDGYTAAGAPLVEASARLTLPAAHVYHDGEYSKGFYPQQLASAADWDELQRFVADMKRWAGTRGTQGRYLFRLPDHYAPDDPRLRRLDAMTMAEYLRQRRFHSPLLRWYIDNRLIDEYGAPAERVSAYAGVLYWAAQGGELNAPHVRGVVPHHLSWPTGTARLIDPLVAQLPRGALRTGSIVIEAENRDGLVWVTTLDPRTRVRHVYRARACIWAAPKVGLRYFLPELAAAGRREAETLDYTPWLVANVLLGDCPRHAAKALAWDNLIFGSWTLGFINGSHFRTPGSDPNQPFMLTMYACLHGDSRARHHELLRLDWRTWANLIVRELKRVFPDVQRHLRRIDVWRWGHAMVRPAPGLFFGGTRQALRRPLGGIHFAGNDVGVLPLYETAVYEGVRAAEGVMHDLGQPFRSML